MNKLPLGILLLLLGGCEQQRSELPPPAPLGCKEDIRTMAIATRLACARHYYIRGCALGDGKSCTAMAEAMLNHPVEE